MKRFVLACLMTAATSSYAAPKKPKPLEQNKVLVATFYEMAFVAHKPKEAADKYLNPSYRQHNPNVGDGRQPFVDFFVPFFEKNPEAQTEIKRVIAEGDLVVLHVHSKVSKADPGRAVVDIFRVKDGKIVEHWDVMQPVPEKSVNSNSMF